MKRKQQANNDLTAPFQPLMDIATVNLSTAQKFTELQAGFITNLMDLGLNQLQALSDAKDPQQALELQLKWIKTLNTKWDDLTEQEIKTAREAQASITGILEKNTQITDIFEQFNGISRH